MCESCNLKKDSGVSDRARYELCNVQVRADQRHAKDLAALSAIGLAQGRRKECNGRREARGSGRYRTCAWVPACGRAPGTAHGAQGVPRGCAHAVPRGPHGYACARYRAGRARVTRLCGCARYCAEPRGRAVPRAVAHGAAAFGAVLGGFWGVFSPSFLPITPPS